MFSSVVATSGLTEAIKTTGDTYDAIGKLFEEQVSVFRSKIPPGNFLTNSNRME